MQELLALIQARLNDHPYANVLAPDLDRVWPLKSLLGKDREARNQLILQFAAEHGLTVTLSDHGRRATFRKAEPEDEQGREWVRQW